MLPPRKDRLSWGDEFMLQAVVASWRSPDPNTQVGAVIVDNNNCIVGTGYNSFPRGISVVSLPWDRNKQDPLENKYAYVVHAEKNAIQNCRGSVFGHVLYVTMHPCNNCAIDVIQAGLRKVFYLSNPYHKHWSTKAAVNMFNQALVDVEQYKWKSPDVVSSYLENLLTSFPA